MTRKLNVRIKYWFTIIVFFQCNVFCLSQLNNRIKSSGVEFELSYERQAYLENYYINTRSVNIEKSAEVNTSYKILLFFDDYVKNQNFIIRFSFGYKGLVQGFQFNDNFSSDVNFTDMGTSSIKADYLCISAGAYYQRNNNHHRIHFLPGVTIGENLLIEKNETLKPLKYTFRDILNPGSDFVVIVPDISFNAIFRADFASLKSSLFLGINIKNNPRYYHESIGILSSPISASFTTGVSKTF